MHLVVTKPIENIAKYLAIKIKGKESFNFKNFKRREDESCRNYYTILDHKVVLCHFENRTIAVGQYSFAFNIELPSRNLPASYLRRSIVNGEGALKAKIRYSIQAIIKGFPATE